jgi:uncharacterized protein (TIGR00730 family)
LVKTVKSVSVYCGSSTLAANVYRDAAKRLGEILAHYDIQLIYGGGRLGLMGLLADAVLANGGQAIGFISHHLDQYEGAHTGLNELHIVDSMHTRKLRMSERGEAFIVLPGGFGTLDEAFEVITWKQLKLHSKPIILVNINNYWDPLIALIKQVAEQRFAAPEDIGLVTVVSSVEEIIPYIQVRSQPEVGLPAELA